MHEAGLKESILGELCLILGHEVSPTEDLLVEGGLDSFGIMQMVVFLEESLGILLPESSIVNDNFANAEVIADWVMTALNKAK